MMLLREIGLTRQYKDIVKELYNKGYKTEQLMTMLDKKIGPEAATRLARFII